MMSGFRYFELLLLTTFFFYGSSGTKDSVRLRDIEVLTLYKDKWTTGRRSQPVPQLKCVGGTAGCSGYVPNVVQCYSRGFDGTDVQWECKADMDSSYKFGEIQVTCEGYDYPDDPYVLKGSCGLEYHLDYAGGGNAGYGGYSDQSNYKKQHKQSSLLSDLVFYAIVAFAIYTIYRVFVNMSDPSRQPRGGGGDGGFGGGPGDGGPPPPGFRPDYYPGDSCSGTQGQTFHQQQQPHAGRPGFWTGLGAGGLLGYMMGNRGNQGYGGYGYGRQDNFWGGGGSSRHASPFGGGGGFGGGGTRTTSGFGGTRRR